MSLLLFASLTAPQTAHADPSIILFGGGWGPEGTQASIEAQVDAFARVLAPKKPLILFGGGDAVHRTVQVPAAETDEIGALLGLVWGREDYLQVAYRPVQNLKTAKAANRENLIAALQRDDASGTVVFGAGHGSEPTEDTPVALQLWGPNDALSVLDLAALLDTHRKKGPMAFVLGQCHSGAFTDLSYRAANPKNGIARPTRCSFAAVPRDREAAGCTPDIDDKSARSFLAVFAEALQKKIDLDEDGKTSLQEAHAYARIHDQTVDVPVSSSEQWMARTLGTRTPDPTKRTLKKLLSEASKTERAVLEALKPQKIHTVVGAKTVFLEITRRIETEETRLDEVLDRKDEIRRQLIDRVFMKWPELANPFHEAARRLLAHDAHQVVSFIKEQRELDDLYRVGREAAALDGAILQLQKRAAVLERFLRAAQIVVNERAIRRGKNRKRIRTLDALLTCERLVP